MSILHLLSAIANGVKAKENTVASNKDLRFFIFKHSVISIKNKFFRQPKKGYSTLFCTHFVFCLQWRIPRTESAFRQPECFFIYFSFYFLDKKDDNKPL